tara:strand:- start:667 stop:843 length:177 start_codon:yes stop_codon:yes gene_type:complete
MFKQFKSFLDLSNETAGPLEYTFAILAILGALPAVICYFLIARLIMSPVRALVKSVWK